MELSQPSRPWSRFAGCVVLVGLVLLTGSTALADVAPDRDYDSRRLRILEERASLLVANNPYDNPSCRDVGGELVRDASALVAIQKLRDMGQAPADAPSDVAALTAHIANKMLFEIIGSREDKQRCNYEFGHGYPAAISALSYLAYLLHQWGDGWPPEARSSVAAAVRNCHWRNWPPSFVVNMWINLTAAKILAAEAMDDQQWFDRWKTRLRDTMFANVRRNGGLELNSPTYTGIHFSALLMLMDAEDPDIAAMGRILLDYEMLVTGHLSLPGGSVGVPKSRTYAGGSRENVPHYLQPALWALMGVPDLPELQDSRHPVALFDYRPPQALRSLFVDKGDGYSYWGWTHAAALPEGRPHSVYDFGHDDQSISPWYAVQMPGGRAMMGVSFGWRYNPLFVSFGVVTEKNGEFSFLYQYQPLTTADTMDDGSGMGWGGTDDSVNDFTSELYDYERLVHKRTLISLWDPTMADKDASKVTRSQQYTLAHIPNWAHPEVGDEAIREGKWHIGRVGEVFVAWRPLGEVVESVEIRDGKATRVEVDGRSGMLVELATTADFPTIDAYAQNLAGRNVEFTTGTELVAEFEAWDPDEQRLVPLRLEYRPERRWIDGREVSISEALDHGLMASPFVQWDRDDEVLTLQRDCYPSVSYDWNNLTVTEIAPPAGCSEIGDAGGAADAGDVADTGADTSGDDASSASDGGRLSDGDAFESDESTGQASNAGGCACSSTPTNRKIPVWLWFLIPAVVGRRLCKNIPLER